MNRQKAKKQILKLLLKVKGDWFDIFDWKKVRSEISERFNKPVSKFLTPYQDDD